MTEKQALRIAKSKLAEQKKWHRGAGDDVKTPGVEFWKLVVSLFKKSIAKDVKRCIDEDGCYLGYTCPYCGNGDAIDYDGIIYFRYCGRCGQKIKWDNAEVMERKMARERIVPEARKADV